MQYCKRIINRFCGKFSVRKKTSWDKFLKRKISKLKFFRLSTKFGNVLKQKRLI